MQHDEFTFDAYQLYARRALIGKLTAARSANICQRTLMGLTSALCEYRPGFIVSPKGVYSIGLMTRL